MTTTTITISLTKDEDEMLRRLLVSWMMDLDGHIDYSQGGDLLYLDADDGFNPDGPEHLRSQSLLGSVLGKLSLLESDPVA